MPRVKVQLTDGIKRVIWLDSDATNGATIGSNFYDPNGKVLSVAGLKTLLGIGTGGSIRQGSGIIAGNDSPQTVSVNQAFDFKWTGQHQWSQALWGPSGTAAAPAFTFTSDPDTGLYDVGANNPGFAVGGVKTWDLNSTRSLQIVPMTVAMTVADNVTQSLIYASATNPGGTDIDVFEISAPMTSGASSAGLRMAMWDVYPGGAGARGFRWDETQAGSTAAALAFYVHHNSDSGTQVYSAAGDKAQLLFVSGSSSVPPVALGVTNNGLFWDSVNARIGVTLGGTYSFSFGSDAFRSNYPIVAGAGTASFPGYTFAADPNTGMYDFAADQLGFSVGGTTTLIIKTTAFTASQPWQGQDGTAAAPAFSFSADTDNGMYRITTNTVGFATAGTERFRIGASGQLGVAGANFGTSGYPLLSQGSGAAPQWAQLGLAGLDQSIAPTWTGAHIFSLSGYGTAAAVRTASAQPAYAWDATGGGVDSKWWDAIASATQWALRTVKDDNSAAREVLKATRSGVALTLQEYGNSTDNPAHKFYGTPDFNTVTTTTSAPGAGGAGALPATPTGYFTMKIGGVDRQIPYY